MVDKDNFFNFIKEKGSFVRLRENDKIPLGSHKNWQNEKCPFDEIKNHNGNFGLATGQISDGIYIFDWDFREGRKKEGFEIIYEEYKKNFSRLSNTTILNTPHGIHVVYIIKDVNIPNSSLTNGGYSDTLKSFCGSHSTRFGTYLKGFDTRGDGGYIVIPPSKVNGLKYEAYNDIEPLEITKDEYDKIFDFFEEKDITSHTMRKGFIDIAIGKINPQEYKHETGLKEHVYWKEFYHEVYSCLGLFPEEMFDGLERNNKGFDENKTITQLNNDKNRDYILNNKRMSKDKYNIYFPKYQQVKNIFEERKEDPKQLVNLVTEDSKQEELEKIYSLLSNDDIVLKNEVFHIIKIKKKISKTDQEKIFQKVQKEKENIRNDIFAIEERKKKNIEIYNSIDHRNGTIENRVDGVFFVAFDEGGTEREVLILESPLTLIHKTKYMNTDLFSYEFRGNVYNTQSRSDILIELEMFRYEGDRGKDFLKKLITIMGDELEYTHLEPILGFNNKWVLPQLQEENNYRILISSDFQKDVYENSKVIYSTDYKLNEIQKKIKEFLKMTTMHPGKVAIIIGWTIAQLFRLSFIKYWRFAPDALLIGEPQTGKTAFGEVMITNFYKAWKNVLQGAQIATRSSFEDVASSSTFPVLVDELEHINSDVTDPMKARASLITDFSRKLDARKKFSKPEVAGFCITTNDIPKIFYNSALIERFIVLSFSSDEIIDEKQEWNDKANELRELNTFSPIYDFTKEWTDKDVFDLVKTVQKECPLFTFDARLRKKFIFVLFGLFLFERIFDIDLTSNLEIFLFELSGRIITGDLLNDFVNFCNIAIDYDAGSQSPSGIQIKGDNPKFITMPLQSNKTGDYIFIPGNLRDFKDFIGNKEYKMRNLSSQLNKSIGEKDYFLYGNYSVDGNPYTGIKIRKDFNERVKQLKKG